MAANQKRAREELFEAASLDPIIVRRNELVERRVDIPSLQQIESMQGGREVLARARKTDAEMQQLKAIAQRRRFQEHFQAVKDVHARQAQTKQELMELKRSANQRRYEQALARAENDVQIWKRNPQLDAPLSEEFFVQFRKPENFDPSLWSILIRQYWRDPNRYRNVSSSDLWHQISRDWSQQKALAMYPFYVEQVLGAGGENSYSEIANQYMWDLFFTFDDEEDISEVQPVLRVWPSTETMRRYPGLYEEFITEAVRMLNAGEFRSAREPSGRPFIDLLKRTASERAPGAREREAALEKLLGF